MKPVQIVAQSSSTSGEKWELQKHDGSYYLLEDGTVISSTYSTGSEQTLAELGCKPSRPAKQPKVLIAGIELGLVLAGARNALPQKQAEFQVAEPSVELLKWHQKYLEELHPEQLLDTRVCIMPYDVDEALEGTKASTLNAILVGGGVGAEDFVSNRSLSLAYQALKSGGLLAIRYVDRASSPMKALRKAGFDVAYERVSASLKGKSKQQHTIWLARKGIYSRSRNS